MRNKFKIRYYSDSLGLPRPNEVNKDERYIEYLISFWKSLNKNVTILERSRANYTIVDLNKWMLEDRKYYGEKVDVCILHEGVVDCAPRPIPRKIRNFISALPEFLKKKIIKFIHNNRSKIQNLGVKYYLTKPDKFYESYKAMVSQMLNDSKKVYLINIAPTNEKTENHSPGFTKSIKKYNKIIKEIVNEINSPKLFLIDLYSIISTSDQNLNKLIIEHDGHHITSLCHRIIANKIIDFEKQ